MKSILGFISYTNIYLLIGTRSALLIDTGCGLFPLKPIIDDLIFDRTLLVINTHSHFDHICGNHEFDKVMIHKKERRLISKPCDVSFLRDSAKSIVKRYENNNYILSPTKEIQPVIDNQVIDLGQLTVKIFHTPGHSPGCICLLTNKQELFTGDTVHYGAMYLTKATLPITLSSISILLELYQENENIEIYPSHEEFAVNKNLLIDLSDGIRKIDDIWETRIRDDFLGAWLLSDVNFKYVIF